MANHVAIIGKLFLVLQYIGIHMFTTELTDPKPIDLGRPIVVKRPSVGCQVPQQNRECVKADQEETFGIHKHALIQNSAADKIGNVAKLVLRQALSVSQHNQDLVAKMRHLTHRRRLELCLLGNKWLQRAIVHECLDIVFQDDFVGLFHPLFAVLVSFPLSLLFDQFKRHALVCNLILCTPWKSHETPAPPSRTLAGL